MLKICFIIPNLLPVPNVKGGAIETIMTNIVSEHEKRNEFDMTVVSIYDKNAFLESKKFTQTKFIFIKKNLKYVICSILFKISNKVFKTNFNTYNYSVLNKIKKIPFDYIIAEGGHYESYNSFLKFFKRDQLVLHLHHKGDANEIIDKTFSKLIGVSNFVIDEFKKSSKIREYFLLKNSIKISNFDKKLSLNERKSIRDSLGISKHDFVVIYCGRLIKEKGVLELIKAVNLIDKLPIKLIVIGSINFANGGKDSYVDLLNNEIKNSNKVVLTGYVANDALYKYYNSSDVMVVPSLWYEAAGLVCIEGMICKKPIITTGVGGIKEYVGNNAIIVQNDDNLIENIRDAIIYCYNNRGNLSVLGDDNYREALQYSNGNYYDNLVKIVKEDFKDD